MLLTKTNVTELINSLNGGVEISCKSISKPSIVSSICECNLGIVSRQYSQVFTMYMQDISSSSDNKMADSKHLIGNFRLSSYE